MKLEALSSLGAEFAPRMIGNVKLSEVADMDSCLVTTTGSAGDFAAALGAALSMELPHSHGAITSKEDRRAIWLTPRSWIVTCAPGDASAMVDAVADAFPDHAAWASLYSDALCWLSLEGAGAEDLLRQGSFLSFAAGGLPIGHAKRTSVAGIPAVLLRTEDMAWTIAVERSRAPYFVEWLASLTFDFPEGRI